MTDSRVLHVERTTDPRVLRWVTHDPELAATASGTRDLTVDSALAPLLANGSLSAVSVVDGDVLVGVDDPTRWTALAPTVHEAIVADLACRSGWLFAAPHVRSVAVSMDAVQRTIDEAAGTLLASHGGRIDVEAVHDGRAYVRMQGACRGCTGAASTLRVAVRTAVLRAHSDLVDIVDVDDVAEMPGSEPLRGLSIDGRDRRAVR